MKSKQFAVGVAALALALVAGGCSSSSGSTSNAAAADSLNAPPARNRGLMIAGDSLGRAVFSDNHPALTNVPDRDR